MFLALEPVTLKTGCLKSNIHGSDITNLLLVFTSANLGCQISLLDFKGWCGQGSGKEVVLEPFGAHISGLLIDGLQEGNEICCVALPLLCLNVSR